jgi:hypothetical protein
MQGVQIEVDFHLPFQTPIWHAGAVGALRRLIELKTIPMTVLITTANNPPQGMPFLQMSDPVMRTIAAKAALYFWVSQGIEQIVLVDATGTNLLSEYEAAEIDKSETRVEQINYTQSDEGVIKQGKGYGEGKLIEYAINNSELLARQEHFFKCTGKLYARNFQTIAAVIKANNITNLFWKFMGDGSSTQPWADCRLYYTSKSFAKNHLIPAYLQSDDHAGITCEYHIHEALERNMKVVRGLRPLITGYCGATGEAYFDSSLGSLDHNFPCWLTQR